MKEHGLWFIKFLLVIPVVLGMRQSISVVQHKRLAAATLSDTVSADITARFNLSTSPERDLHFQFVQGNADSWSWSLSGDGRFVAFRSSASDLVDNDINGQPDAFVYDRQTGKIECVSISSNDTQGNESSAVAGPAISADGRFVAFPSYATNLVSGDTNNKIDVFVHDRENRSTSRISVSSNGAQSNGDSYWPAISADGRYVAFFSSASNLVQNDTNDAWDVFVHDQYTGSTTRVSVASSGAQANGDSGLTPYSYGGVSISSSGRFVAFESYASNLVFDDTNDATDIFVHDRETARTEITSLDSSEVQGNGYSGGPSISANGRFVAFHSYANNLVNGDTNDAGDIFVRDIYLGKTSRLSVASYGTQANGHSSYPSISANGRIVIFTSDAGNLVSDDTNGVTDVFIRDRYFGETERVSLSSDGIQSNAGSGLVGLTSVSADGYFVTFDSDASNLASGDNNGYTDVFVHNRTGGQTQRVSVPSQGDGEGNLEYLGTEQSFAHMMEDEIDQRITPGDHVHLRIPFENVGGTTIDNAKVHVTGGQLTGNSVGISIHNGASWRNYRQTVHLKPLSLAPGEIGIADFWIYVTNPDPDFLQSTPTSTWIQLSSNNKEWTIPIRLETISFNIPAHRDMLADSCLHHPNTSHRIQRYAQYAAGNSNLALPTNLNDPDTAEQAVRNLLRTVAAEFDSVDTEATRVEDTTLLTTRHGKIGKCRHFADLTVSLLRALELPARYAGAKFIKGGHAWAEVYINHACPNGWSPADAAWSGASWYEPFAPQIYEEKAGRFLWGSADLFPLSNAQSGRTVGLLCTPACYSNIDCRKCKFGQFNPDTSCVEKIGGCYHNYSILSRANTENESEEIFIDINAPAFVTRTVPFSTQVLVSNRSSMTLKNITTTISAYREFSSTVRLYDFNESEQLITSLSPDSTISLTWVVTPLVSGTNVPLEALAFNDVLAAGHHQIQVVNEPGSLLPLTLINTCGGRDISVGESITLTATILDEQRQVVRGDDTLVTATLYSTPTLGFSTTVNLPYCKECDRYQQRVQLPTDAPVGRYVIEYLAQRPGYTSKGAISTFFATPRLTLVFTATPSTLGWTDPITLTAQVRNQSSYISHAGVYAEITKSGESVQIPMLAMGVGETVYTATFLPADLVDNPSALTSGQWTIKAIANYQGSEAIAIQTINVRHSIYLPFIIRQ